MELMLRPEEIYIHHSATTDSQTLSFDAITRYHIETNGWDDVGYHFGVEKVNDQILICSGRGLQYEGAHAAGYNKSIGVCVVGNYDAQPPAPEVLVCLTRLLKSILVLYPHLRPQDVRYHNEVSAKTCPGKFFPRVELLRGRLLALGC